MVVVGDVLKGEQDNMPEHTLTTPVTYPSETKYVIYRFEASGSAPGQATCLIIISVKGSNDESIRQFECKVPDETHPSATVSGVFNALDTAVQGEPAGALARSNYRLLKYLADNGYFPPGTLNP